MSKYNGKTITILETEKVFNNCYISETNRWMGILKHKEYNLYSIEPSKGSWEKDDWLICDQSIDELLELGAITIT